ncbi:MAG TPA: ATP-binding protein [Rhizomicrobium sp.]|nr:ATP-binding protein [Rhizomicrobium sp.]
MQNFASLRNRLNRMVAALGVATVVVVFACFVAIIWILSLSSQRLDEAEAAGQARLVKSVIDDYAGDLAKAVGDYTAWNELYEYFDNKKDPKWERLNLGPYLASTFGIGRAFAVTRKGEIVYSYAAASATPPKLSPGEIKILRDMARLAFRAEKPDRQVGVAGMVAFRNGPALTAASTVRASSLRSPSRVVFIEARPYDRRFLDELSRNLGVRDLRVVRGKTNGLALAAPDGKASGLTLVWARSRSGSALLSRVLPMVALVGASALAALLGLAFVWWRVFDQMRAAERSVNEAMLKASAARARAAEETSKSKSAFIANMSHELRTPLNAIIGFSELVLSEVLGPLGVEKYREYIAAIHKSGQHLLSIVNDILQVAKIEARGSEINAQPVAIDEVVRDCVEMLAVLADQRAIALAVSPAKESCKVVADRQALHQILINIVANAVKFSPEGGNVEIFWSAQAGKCELRIVDHGCGIPPETLRNIGKPFVQAEGAYARKYQGAGLGLTISFLLAEAMGASIELKSAVNAGTTAIVWLPLSAAQDAAGSLAA